ncbi:hypothetical protein ACHAPI_011671 [Fusarium lateritium]
MVSQPQQASSYSDLLPSLSLRSVREYIIDAFAHLPMEDVPETEQEEKEELENNRARVEGYDSNEETNSSFPKNADSKVNSQSAVHYMHDPSFVSFLAGCHLVYETPGREHKLTKLTRPASHLFGMNLVLMSSLES